MNTIDLLTESGHQILVESGNNHLIVWRKLPSTAGSGGSKYARGAKPPAPIMSPYAQRGFGNVGYRKVRIKNLVTIKITFDDEETSFAVDMNTKDFQPAATIGVFRMGQAPVVTISYPRAIVSFVEDEA